MAKKTKTAPFQLKIAAISLAVIMCGNLSFPARAHAVLGVGDIVIDPTNLVQNIISATNASAVYTKDYVLDTLAWKVGELAIESITKSTVNWINSGFNGSPAFVTDLNQNLRGVGDAVAARFFDELSQQTIATTPFQDKVLDNVRLAYYLRTSPESFYTKNPYTLNQVSPDSRAFLNGDFSQGGFNALFATFINPQNNQYGAQMLADQALQNAVESATGNRLEELSWNRGFLSWRGDCPETNTGGVVNTGGEEECVGGSIKTPGSVIMEQLNTQLGSGINRLVSADEFNEIIGALLNQLATQVLGGNSGGLAGVSRPSTGGGASFLEQSTSGSQATASGTNISASFRTTIANQKKYVSDYRANWEKIRSAATAANERCGAEGSPTPEQVITRAAAALVKAANATAALDALEVKINAATAAGGNQTLALLAVSEEYSVLTTSDTLPSAEEIAEAGSEAQDTGDADTVSLYTQMTRLANSSSCR